MVCALVSLTCFMPWFYWDVLCLGFTGVSCDLVLLVWLWTLGFLECILPKTISGVFCALLYWDVLCPGFTGVWCDLVSPVWFYALVFWDVLCITITVVFCVLVSLVFCPLVWAISVGGGGGSMSRFYWGVLCPFLTVMLSALVLLECFGLFFLLLLFSFFFFFFSFFKSCPGSTQRMCLSPCVICGALVLMGGGCFSCLFYPTSAVF